VVVQVAQDELCRRFMGIPGVGPVTALAFTAVGDPTRFKRSRDVAAYFGLTSKRWQSGTSIDIQGRISKAGDPDVRRSLYEAAAVLLKRFRGRDKVKTWGLLIAKRSCHDKAAVAVARKLAVIMHAMWSDGTCYCGDADASPAQQEQCARECTAHRSSTTTRTHDPATRAALPVKRSIAHASAHPCCCACILTTCKRRCPEGEFHEESREPGSPE
jgi:transposase